MAALSLASYSRNRLFRKARTMAVRAIEWAKHNPGKTVFIVGAGAVLLWVVFFRGTGGATVAYGSSHPSDAEIQSGTAIQLAQQAGAQQAGQQQFQIAYLQQQQAGEFAMTQLQGNVALQGQANQLSVQQTVSLATLSTQEAVAKATLDAQTAWATITSGAQIATQQIAAAQTIQLAQIQSSTNLGIAQISGQTQTTLAQYQRDVAIAQAHYQAETTIAGYTAQNVNTGISGLFGLASNLIGAIF